MIEANYQDIGRSFLRDGFYIKQNLLDADLVLRLGEALRHAIKSEKQYHRPGQDDEFQVACCPYYDDIFLQVLRGFIFDVVDSLLGADSILYHYGSSCIKPGAGNFSSRVHVERDYFTGPYLEGIGVLILLSDFSDENGATCFLPGSQLRESMPEASEFAERAIRLVAPAGSVFFFHPHLWHAGGVNNTTKIREALTMGFCRGYLKQRLDMPALMAQRLQTLVDRQLRQKLGVHASPPKTLAEFYSRKGGWNPGNE